MRERVLPGDLVFAGTRPISTIDDKSPVYLVVVTEVCDEGSFIGVVMDSIGDEEMIGKYYDFYEIWGDEWFVVENNLTEV